MSEWHYKQTSLAVDRETEEFDNKVNAHLAEMADAGWELVTSTSTIAGTTSRITLGTSHGKASCGVTTHHHYIWKQPR
ncbi:hypothetical protein [Amycolatopsis japonica]|uniref:hypothetical protein n=1 Tax=Amycolatopsis japonica TaxID=208439 RepID=UPI0033D1B8A6